MTTEADDSQSSLDTASIIGQISPLKLDTYYDTAKRGCGKRCPCRGWINCSYYVNIEKQQRRLRNKHDNHYKNIHLWYDVNFRIRYEHGESIGNG
jgi:hypothetical protein